MLVLVTGDHSILPSPPLGGGGMHLKYPDYSMAPLFLNAQETRLLKNKTDAKGSNSQQKGIDLAENWNKNSSEEHSWP